jgi:hypothetical protein
MHHRWLHEPAARARAVRKFQVATVSVLHRDQSPKAVQMLEGGEQRVEIFLKVGDVSPED